MAVPSLRVYLGLEEILFLQIPINGALLIHKVINVKYVYRFKFHFWTRTHWICNFHSQGLALMTNSLLHFKYFKCYKIWRIVPSPV